MWITASDNRLYRCAVPETGKWQEVSPRILWLGMALSFELDHINLYLVEGNDIVTHEQK